MKRRRPETLKSDLLWILGHTIPASSCSIEPCADILGRLPVAAKQKAAKRALIRKLKTLSKELNALKRRIMTASDRIERLSLDETTKLV
jgi:hypothetical protein